MEFELKYAIDQYKEERKEIINKDGEVYVFTNKDSFVKQADCLIQKLIEHSNRLEHEVVPKTKIKWETLRIENIVNHYAVMKEDGINWDRTRWYIQQGKNNIDLIMGGQVYMFGNLQDAKRVMEITLSQ